MSQDRGRAQQGLGRDKIAYKGGGTGGTEGQLFTKQCKNSLPWVNPGSAADRLPLPPTWQAVHVCVKGILRKKGGPGWSQGNLLCQ